MDSHNLFLAGLSLLGIFVIAVSIWVILMPPRGDEPQAYALTVIGIFMIYVGYVIAQRNRNQ